jgi:acyl-CoA hydrolase
MRIVSVSEAMSAVTSDMTVFLHGGAATPRLLINGLVERAEQVRNVTIVSLHTEGAGEYVDPKYQGIFHVKSLFAGADVREAIARGDADYIPVFLSEIPALFASKTIPLSIALINVSPPDSHGYCSLGVSVDVAKAAVENSEIVIAQINSKMPRTHGDSFVHVDKIDFGVEVDHKIWEMPIHTISGIEGDIGRFCAGLIEDGSTLQMGIGGIPDAVLSELTNHKDLGVHTEMFSDGLLPLIRSGAVTGSKKRVLPGRVVSSFAMGSAALVKFLDDNPIVCMLESSFVNDTHIIRKNPKVVAINSAIEVDITGQIVADSIGTRHYSGIGGQMDFMRGAALSEGGKPVIALPSCTSHGDSRIVAFLKPGANVVTTRGHVHYVVTEYGIARLYGKTLRERAAALIGIAHPRHREELEREARARFGKFVCG